jgi:small subunit ribosomal protein S2
MVFVVDPKREDIAVDEARRLGIPVVAITDTNCDPDLIDHVIPGNDDAIKSIKLVCAAIADAVLEGIEAQARTGEEAGEETAAGDAAEEAAAPAEGE